jgi:hypothetical protein
METVNLPDKPSELIRLALHDMRLCEVNPDYKFDMATWHTYVPSEHICYVCLAGSVVANTLKYDVNKCFTWNELGKETQDKLDFLDSIRRGYTSTVEASLISLGLDLPENFDWSIMDKHRNSDNEEAYTLPAFYQYLEDIANEFEKHNM